MPSSPRMRIVGPWIGAAGVAVAGSMRMQAREVHAERGAAVGRNRVDRPVVHVEFPPVDIANHADEVIVAPVVVQDQTFGPAGCHCSIDPCCQFHAWLFRQRLKAVALAPAARYPPRHCRRRRAADR